MRLPNIEPDVYASRPVLKAIRDETHRKCTSADAALWSVLAIVAGGMPHYVTIDTGIRSPQVPSLFAVLAGPSGSGKSTAWRIARALVPDGPTPLPLSTGEGLIEAYYGRVQRFERTPQLDDQGETKTDKDGNPRPDKVRSVWVRQQVAHNAVAMVDEGAALFRHIERPGNVVAETLRQMWSGSEAGQANADPDRRRVLEAGSYNLGLVVGLQPDIAGTLLADTGTGFAQRFVWAASTDAHIPDLPPPWLAAAPTFRLSWCPPIPGVALPGLAAFQAQTAGQDAPPEPVRMSVEPSVVAGLAAAQLARARGAVPDEDEHDSQRTAMHIKIAGVLAWLDGRLAVTADDWGLAGALLDTSDGVRAALLDHADSVSARKRAERGIERAQVSAAEAEADVRRERLRDQLVKLLAEADSGSLTRSELRRGVNSAARSLVVDVLDAEVARGTFVEIPTPGGGTRYALAGAS